MLESTSGLRKGVQLEQFTLLVEERIPKIQTTTLVSTSEYDENVLRVDVRVRECFIG